MSTNSEQLKALLALLEDPDPIIQEAVDQAILALGEAAIPHLESHWFQTQDIFVQSRIEGLLETITLDRVSETLYQWRQDLAQPLWPALMAVSRLQYPALQVEKYLSLYSRLVHKTWLAFPQSISAIDKLLAINQQLFHGESIGPEITRPKHPLYYYLHHLLETRRGNSFSLSVLYYMIARDLEVEGLAIVSIQGRYLIRYYDGDVHFYLDPYQKGVFIRAEELKAILARLALADNLARYPSLSPPYIIIRLVMHLEQAYRQQGHEGTAQLHARLRERLLSQFSGGGTI